MSCRAVEVGSETIASLIESLEHPERAVVRAAVDRLIAIGPQMPEVEETLGRLLPASTGNRRWPIAYTLAHLSSPSPLCLDVLKEGLGSEDRDIRWATLRLITRLGEGDNRVRGLLSGLLKSGSPTQRRMAVYALRDLGLEGEEALDTLRHSLRDRDPMVRVAAVTTLARQPRVGQDGLDILLGLRATDPDQRVRQAAAFALERSGVSTGGKPKDRY